MTDWLNPCIHVASAAQTFDRPSVSFLNSYSQRALTKQLYALGVTLTTLVVLIADWWTLITFKLDQSWHVALCAQVWAIGLTGIHCGIHIYGHNVLAGNLYLLSLYNVLYSFNAHKVGGDVALLCSANGSHGIIIMKSVWMFCVKFIPLGPNQSQGNHCALEMQREQGCHWTRGTACAWCNNFVSYLRVF